MTDIVLTLLNEFSEQENQQLLEEPSSMLEYKHLVSLATIRETNSLILAAKILNMSLPALSRQIKELENHYNCVLFLRKTRPVQFTPTGTNLLELADKVIPLFQDSIEKLSDNSRSRPAKFNIALECHSCYQWLIPAISECRAKWHETDIDLSAEFNFHPLPQLLTGELDLVITGDPNPLLDVEYIPLFDYELLIGVSLKHKLASKDFAKPSDLANDNILTYPVEKSRLSILNKFLVPGGITPKSISTAELTLMLVEMTSSGRGVCCLPSWAWDEYSPHSNVVTLKMGENGMHESLYVACRREDKNNDGVVNFISIAKKTCLNKLKGIRLR